VHFDSSIRGTEIPTEVTWWIEGDKKMWELGSSTSQSISSTVSFERERAKLTAMVVFPVPPLPLAIDMIMALFSFSE
jgi:hypothetical protein